MAGKVVLLDGYSLLYRAFHALQAPMTAPDGTPTNAVHGFMMMLLKVLEEEKPRSMAVAFDVHAKTHRAEQYEAYKATRKPMPDELRAQVPIVRELIGQMGLPLLELEGFEADDILGTASAAAERENRDVILVTGDRDSFQLSGPHTTILYTKKGITDTVRVTPEWIRETYGLTPNQMIDVKGLMGDASDNIPGVPGIGEKTALKLIAEYGSLQRVLDTAETDQKGKLRERLMEHRDLAELSYRLATIDRCVPLAMDFDAWKLDGLGNALPRLRELRMAQASRRLEELLEQESLPLPRVKAPAGALPPVQDLPDLSALEARCAHLAEQARQVSLYLGESVSVCVDGCCLSLPLGGETLLDPGIDEADAVRALQPLLEAGCEKVLWNVKDFPDGDHWPRGPIHDVMLAAYALDPQRSSFQARALCEQAGVDGFSQCPAWALTQLCALQKEELVKNGLEDVYRAIELPLARVLRDMEKTGVRVDAEILRALGTVFEEKIAALIEEIDALAGEKINLNSPKQLAELLYDRLKIPAPRKRSTSAQHLEELADAYPICGRILEYRKYQKLESTYIHSLTTMQDARGRIHTRFDQVATATGRISSSEPNLQNIPVRTELGREIRRAFVASPGCVLVDADYSQIELRVLAHISGDARMCDAFREGQDIHARTASEVYGVPLSEVTGAMRSSCKAVNFGIVYGISDFTLARNINVSRAEARSFIDRYFDRYPGVKAYMDRAVAEGRAQGYVTTMMNRRRYLPELKSSNFNVRTFGERCAMNSPIQGTAADIIKLAMVAVHRRLEEEGLSAKLILQVHDELILDTPEEETEAVRTLLKDCMEHVVRLDVPLVADINVGGDWRACK